MENQKSKFKIELTHRAYRHSIKAIIFIDSLPKDTSSGIIAKQLIRSVTSIGANLVEAQNASSKKDFTNFLNHSLKSATESLYWFGLLRDAKKIRTDDLISLLDETKQLANIPASSLMTLKGRK